MKLFFLSALLLAGLTASTNLTAQPMNSDAHAPSLVTVTGMAKQLVKPDQLSFSFQINTEAEDLLKAKQENFKRVNEAVAYLKKAGVPESNIQTQWLNINVQYRDERQLQPRYFAYQSIQVKLTDISKFDQINTELLQRGITGINGPSFSSSKADAIKEEVRVKAVKNARERAEALANALGQKIGPAYSITDVEEQLGNQPMYRMAASAEADGPGIAAGELEVTHSVVVAFYLFSK